MYLTCPPDIGGFGRVVQKYRRKTGLLSVEQESVGRGGLRGRRAAALTAKIATVISRMPQRAIMSTEALGTTVRTTRKILLYGQTVQGRSAVERTMQQEQRCLMPGE